MADGNFFTGEWLRKASMWENVMNNAIRTGNFLICYQLNLKSSLPIKEDHVKAAMVHLYRRVPNLGVCLSTRDDTPWLRRVNNPNVDFKVLRGITVEEVRESLRHNQFNCETGPLFSGRLLVESPDKVTDPEDLDPEMQHSCYMFFGFHHGVVDGTSNMYIMGFFIKMLNDIIGNKPINDDEPLGTFLPDDETATLIQKRKEILLSDSVLRDRLIREMETNKSQIPWVVKGFDAPSNKEKRTVSLDRVLDQTTTAIFVQKCRQEKVTVNSTFTALVNVAIVDVLMQNGVLQDSYCLQNFHLVNLRRYWNQRPKIALGCHIGGPLTIYTDTPRNLTGHKFWDYVRSLHSIIKDQIDSGKAHENQALYSLNSNSELFTEEHLLSEKQCEGDFVTSNLGNVTSLVTEGGEHVKITHVLRSTTMHLLENPIVINYHTFRGKFTMIFDYNAAFIKKDIGEKLCSQILERLRGILV